jgi:2-phospho-L-lactate/phosphoenolpyruvate guanylyltransferase
MNGDVWAVLPVKELDGAKQRLSGLLPPAQRRALAEIMLGEVLEALAAARGLSGLLLVTCEPFAIAAASRLDARVVTEGARAGHTGSVATAARLLAMEGRGGMLALPGDIPAVTAAEIGVVLAAHRPAPSFTIVPAHDEQGSNAVLCSPPDAVPLRFGDDSFRPHLKASQEQGIAPTVLPLPGISMDIDHPADLAGFARLPQATGTRTLAFLRSSGVLRLLQERGLA